MSYNGTVLITDACISLRPTGGVSLSGTAAADVVWDAATLASGDGAPTTAEIEAEQARLQAIEDANVYQRTRAAAYKEIKEQLDQLYHDMTAGKLDATGEWHKAIKAVKDATPKP